MPAFSLRAAGARSAWASQAQARRSEAASSIAKAGEDIARGEACTSGLALTKGDGLLDARLIPTGLERG